MSREDGLLNITITHAGIDRKHEDFPSEASSLKLHQSMTDKHTDGEGDAGPMH